MYSLLLKRGFYGLWGLWGFYDWQRLLLNIYKHASTKTPSFVKTADSDVPENNFSLIVTKQVFSTGYETCTYPF